MQERLTPEGRRIVEELASRHGVSVSAVMTLLEALARGNGSMAQFSHPELGGTGQWVPGGMVMIGDMFNHALKARVDGLCSKLAACLRREPALMPRASTGRQSQMQTSGGGTASLLVPAAGDDAATWYPPELGTPAAAGAQNDLRYAWFPATRRLAVSIGGRVTVYDAGDHRIGGVGQQQGSGAASLTFTSQHGLVPLSSLRVVPVGGNDAAPPHAVAEEPSPAAPSDDVFAKIERLAELRRKGILTEEEYAAKKAELLGRL
jgi:hypothetical protein